MRRMKTHRALESDLVEAPTLPVLTSEVPGTEVLTEPLSTEVPAPTPDLAGIEVISVQTEAAAEVIETLGRVAEVVVASPNGEMSPETAEVVYIATEELCASIGFSVRHPVPTLESFSGPRAKVSTALALESIKEAAKAIWAKIIEAIKKAAVWMKQFVRSMLDFSKHTQAKAARFIKDIVNLEDSPKQTSFTNATLAVKVQYHGKVPNKVSEIAYGTKKLLEAQLTRISHEALDAEQLAHQLVNNTSGFKHSTLKARTASGLNRTVGVEGRFGKEKYLVSEMLLGGKLIIADDGFISVLSRSEDAVSEGADAVAYLMETPRLATQSIENTEEDLTYAYLTSAEMSQRNAATIKVPDHSELKACAECAGAMALGVTIFRSNLNKLEALCDNFAKEAEKIMDSAREEVYEELGFIKNDKQKVQRILRKFYSQAPRMFVKEPTSFANELLQVANNLLDYAGACAKQYKRKESAPAAVEEPATMTPGGRLRLAA